MENDWVGMLAGSKPHSWSVQRLLDYVREHGLAPEEIYQHMPLMQPGAQINHDVSHTADTVGLHAHVFYEILFVSQGTNVQYLLDNNRYQLQKGDIVLIPPGMAHRPLFLSALTEPYDRYALWIDADYYEGQSRLFPQFGHAVEQCRATGSWLLRSTEATYTGLYAGFNMLWREQEQRRFGWQASVAIGALNLVTHISRTFYYRDTAMAQTETRSLFDEAFQYIDSHLAEKLTLALVARQMHVSASTISHLFKSQLGVPFYQCVIQRRLIRAKNSILHGAPLREVWEACGFADYSSFYRLFKKEYGISPTQFRRLNSEG